MLNQIIQVFLPALIFSVIIAVTYNFVQVYVLKVKKIREVIFDIYLRSLSGVILSFFVYYKLSKDMLIVGSLIGSGIIGRDIIVYILKRIGVKDSKIDAIILQEKPPQQKGNFLHLMKLVGLITTEQAKNIRNIQFDEEEKLMQQGQSIENHRKVGQIYVSLQPLILQDLAQKEVDEILKLQADGGYLQKALIELNNLKELKDERLNNKNKIGGSNLK